MNKSERKYYNTACLMDQTLLVLLEKKDFDYITIKEICQKAGVNRSTFYLHYQNTSDLLEETIQYLFDQLKNKYGDTFIDLTNIKTTSLEDLKFFTSKYTVPYFEFVKENQKVFMAAVKEQRIFRVNKLFNAMYEKIFDPILTRFNIPKNERKYMMKFYMSGIHAIIIEWIANNCSDSIEMIASLIEKIVTK